MFIARLLLKSSHLDGCAFNNLPLCHFSCFTSTRADNSADGIKSTSVLRVEWEYEGLGYTEILFRSASFENYCGAPNPRNSNQGKGKCSLPREGKGQKGASSTGLPVPATYYLPS